MSMKGLNEQRLAKVAEMEELLNAAKAEERALSTDENAKFDTLEVEVAALEKTIAAEERARKASDFHFEEPAAGAENRQESTEAAEERAFVDYVMNRVTELRAGGTNMTMGDNGAIIPTSIANRIIKEVKDRCPIYAGATLYSVKGNLKIPKWGANDGHNITVAFHDEFDELVADSGKFTSVDLGGFLVGALTLLGKSLENNAQFNVLTFIVNEMAEEIATFLEGKLLNGESGKNEGALATTNTLTSAASTAVTADELIDLQTKVKQAYQRNACWTMHPDTFAAVKKLKDANGRYMLQDDFTQEIPYRLLGKPVYISDNMPKMETGKAAILYGDYSGLAVNLREQVSITVMREHFLTRHALGVVAWLEFDSKVTHEQKLAVLKMK